MTRSGKLSLALAVLCLVNNSQAQRGPQKVGGASVGPEIRGTVLEAATGQPVGRAEVSLYFLGEQRPTIRYALGSLTRSAGTKTDAAGVFVFHLEELGWYTVAAKREGYSAPAGGEGVSVKDVTLTGAEPVGEARLTLSRPGQVTGTVVDGATGKPLANLSVIPSRVWNNFGRVSAGGSPVNTGMDGRFVAAGLSPGRYVVTVPAYRSGRDRILAKFSKEDLKAVDEDYERSYWPGGQGLDAALPLSLSSGASVDFGAIVAHKVPHYRVHVLTGPCRPGETMSIYEQLDFGMARIGSAPCAPELLISGFRPGAYRLLLTKGKDDNAETFETASVPFVIKDENVEIMAPLAGGVALNVAVVTADGAAAPDFTKVQIKLQPLNALPIMGIGGPTNANASGRARFVGLVRGNQMVLVSGLAPPYYVKEMRFRGIPVVDQVLSLDETDQELSVVIDDKAGVVVGAVTDGDKLLPEPYVVLVRWPLPDAGSPLSPSVATGDDKGGFRFAGVAPGQYRIIALRSASEYRDRLPGTLERALEAATTIEVAPSALQNVKIKATTLR